MPATILIVDDDPVQRRLLESMVRRFGYEAVAVDGGDAGSAGCSAPTLRRRTPSCSTSSCPISTASACSRG